MIRLIRPLLRIRIGWRLLSGMLGLIRRRVRVRLVNRCEDLRRDNGNIE